MVTIDLHTHSTASDGTDTPPELARKAKAAGIAVLAITDHDTAEGVRELTAAPVEGIALIPGIEVSAWTASEKCHILGLGYEIGHPAFRALLEEAAALRRAKLEARIEYLRRRGYGFPEEELAALRAMPSAGKPHLGALLSRYGFAPDRDTAIREIVDPCPTPNDRVEAGGAAAAIRAAGGEAVWAHPMGEEGKRELTPEELRVQLRELLDAGITGMECWYSKYAPERCRMLEKTARAHGLLVSGGSDYHGRNKRATLGQLNSDELAVPAEALTVLEAVKRRYAL